MIQDEDDDDDDDDNDPDYKPPEGVSRILFTPADTVR